MNSSSDLLFDAVFRLVLGPVLFEVEEIVEGRPAIQVSFDSILVPPGTAFVKVRGEQSFVSVDVMEGIFVVDFLDEDFNVIASASGTRRFTRIEVERILNSAHPITIDGRRVEAVNATHHRSSVGHELASRARHGIGWGCVYRLRGDRVDASLYSIGDFDVSVIAARYGGGGHRNASGFSVPGSSGAANVRKAVAGRHEGFSPPVSSTGFAYRRVSRSTQQVARRDMPSLKDILSGAGQTHTEKSTRRHPHPPPDSRATSQRDGRGRVAL